ncbi:hypothetical protein [Candidatus Fukatsuia endosymbiont of Tuberolachnus salignus]|uniref:hypothetical protein n=1 Tax=Candidatus Fukatsuia endosymbiont of Tuberolachnus salignus TaxID=3077957 RepID=UPI00313CA8B9
MASTLGANASSYTGSLGTFELLDFGSVGVVGSPQRSGAPSPSSLRNIASEPAMNKKSASFSKLKIFIRKITHVGKALCIGFVEGVKILPHALALVAAGASLGFMIGAGVVPVPGGAIAGAAIGAAVTAVPAGICVIGAAADAYNKYKDEYRKANEPLPPLVR